MTILLAAALLLQAPVLTPQASNTTARLQAVSVVSPSVVWASGARGTAVRTVDGGASWTAMVVPGADSLEFRDLHAVSADTVVLLAAGPGDRSRIYRTTDGGATWDLRFVNANPDAFFDCLAFWDSRRGLAVSDAVKGEFVMLRTDDGGVTWSAIPSNALPRAREGEGMFAASGTCLVTNGPGRAGFGTGAGRIARVIRTEDWGVSWTEAPTPIVQNTPTAGIMSLVWFDAERGMALGGDLAITDTLTDNVAATTDGGATWQLASGRPAFPGAVYGAARIGRSEAGVVAVGPRGSSWSPDAGATWHPLDGENYWSVGFAADGTGWMVGPGGRITRVRF